MSDYNYCHQLQAIRGCKKHSSVSSVTYLHSCRECAKAVFDHFRDLYLGDIEGFVESLSRTEPKGSETWALADVILYHLKDMRAAVLPGYDGAPTQESKDKRNIIV